MAMSVITAGPIADLETFWNQITTVRKSIYDAATFLNGISIEVELTSLLEVETGRFLTFENRVPPLQESARERPLDTAKFINLAITNWYLRSALRDLNSAMRFRNDTGLYCYRAIETLMQEFKKAGEESKVAWPRFREALQVTQEWIKPLTDNSISNRHGELKALTGPERVMLMKRAWALVFRFARLRLLNVPKLPEAEFPLLDK